MKLPFRIGKRPQKSPASSPEEIAGHAGIAWAPVTTPTKQLFPMWERFLKMAWFLAGLAMIGGAVFVWWAQRGHTRPVVERVLPATQFTSEGGLTIDPALSRTGRILAFSSDRQGAGELAIWVRELPAGSARRLTNDSFHETGPDFSPDETRLVYRSEREGGGIYVADVNGGRQPRRVAAGGWRPRYSPNGKWIAYFLVAGTNDEDSAAGLGQLFIVSPEGGPPKRLQPEFRTARYPVWAPDGQHILFEGTDAKGNADWWVTPIEQGDAVRTHALQTMARSLRVRGLPERWHQNLILFSAAAEQRIHIWKLPISLSTWQAGGAPRQLTDGAGREGPVAVSAGGRLFYSVTERSVDIWSLPLDANQAKVTGELEPLTNNHPMATMPSLSNDGNTMAFISNRSGFADLWVRDLKGGREQAVTGFRRIGYRPILSPDGHSVFYPTLLDRKCALVDSETAAPPREWAVEGCFGLWDVARDGKSLLVFDPAAATHSVDLFTPANRERRQVLMQPKRNLYGAKFSPDGRWIAFTIGLPTGESQIYVAPFRPGGVPAAEWIRASNGPGSLPVWSPDGNVLYYRSTRDGFDCIWAQRLAPTKHPVGEMIPVHHFHGAAFGLFLLKVSDFRLAVAPGRLVMNVAKYSGNLWTTQGLRP